MATALKKNSLTPKEMDFLDHLNVAARIISTPGLTFKASVQQFLDEYPKLDEDAARKWIRKARDFIRDGVHEDIEHSKRRYIHKLEWLETVVRKELVKDHVEITVIKDEGGVAEDGTATSGKAAAGAEPRKVKTKVLTKAFSPQAGNLLFKIMKEHAMVTGARPKDGVRVNLTQNNLTVGANKLQDMDNDDLLKQLGFSNAKVLPGSTEGGIVRQPVADVEGVPIEDGDQDGQDGGPSVR